MNIDKDIPIPENMVPHRNTKYPFALMEFRDSFRIELKLEHAKQTVKRWNKKLSPKEFWAGPHKDHIRVWRVK